MKLKNKIPLLFFILLAQLGLSQNCYEDLKIVANDRAQQNNFGQANDVSGDYAVVSAFWNSYDELGGNYKRFAGAVYIYQKYLV